MFLRLSALGMLLIAWGAPAFEDMRPTVIDKPLTTLHDGVTGGALRAYSELAHVYFRLTQAGDFLDETSPRH